MTRIIILSYDYVYWNHFKLWLCLLGWDHFWLWPEYVNLVVSVFDSHLLALYEYGVIEEDKVIHDRIKVYQLVT